MKKAFLFINLYLAIVIGSTYLITIGHEFWAIFLAVMEINVMIFLAFKSEYSE